MLEALITVTSFHHQPEAQHPISSAIHKNAGRLPHLLAITSIRAIPWIATVGDIADIGRHWRGVHRWKTTRSGSV